jgi:hypothetical protein
MPTIIKKIDKIGKEFLTDFLESSIHGDCYPFAIALHRNLGWPIIGLFKKEKIIHVGVKSPDEKIWDGRGEVSEEELAEPFITSPYSIRHVAEEELVATGTVDEYTIETLLEKAQIVWPDLPWKNGTPWDKVIAFADDLEKLSRKHKLWICGNNPMSLPMIFQGQDDETGYAIEPSIDGNAFTINRALG